MSPKIQILPETIANQIAAGEVVERPASVVKELIENSVDASATEIYIDIEKGGKKLIRVSDNGSGMKKDDAFLCLERHATSKIKDADDLFNLHTMGFRGEALPAIASVSRFKLITRSAEEESGSSLSVEGGEVRKFEAIGTAIGTTIEVRNLFFNTPGRRKFLRKDETEFGHIADVVSRLALARSDIHFRLTHNGRNIIEAYRHNRLAERAAVLLGRQTAGELLSVDAKSGTGEMLVGLLGAPGTSRSTTTNMYTYINGRFVRDRIVQHAILEAYRTLLEKRRYPIAILFIDMPPQTVDVNVHPTKHEVRFRNQQQVHDFIVSALRKKLQENTMTGDLSPEDSFTEASERSLAGISTDRSHQDARVSSLQDSLIAFDQKISRTPTFSAVSTIKGEISAEPIKSAEETAVPDGWRVIGQYLNSYLICQAGDELVLIDQHAAHERIGFERLRQQLCHNGIQSQNLLFPVVIELDHREAAVMLDSLDDFKQFGFDIEAFGGRAFTVKSVPILAADVDAELLVRDLSAELTEIGRSGRLNDEIDKILSVIACHSMVRANQALSISEMQRLLIDLADIDFGSCCPHGRPVMYRLSKHEIEKLFHRG